MTDMIKHLTCNIFYRGLELKYTQFYCGRGGVNSVQTKVVDHLSTRSQLCYRKLK